MSTQALKHTEIVLNISSETRQVQQTNTEFMTYDYLTAKNTVRFLLDNEPFNLSEVSSVKFLFDLDLINVRRLEEATIENVEEGIVSLVLPNYIHQYSANLFVYVYIDFNDGRTLDAGFYQTRFSTSKIDEYLPDMEEFYVKKFEDLAQELRDFVEAQKQGFEADFESFRQQVKDMVDNVQGQIDDIQTQIDEKDIVNRTELQQGLDSKSNVGHGHVIADTTGLQTALDGKSNNGHTHTIANVTNLQSSLDSKANRTLAQMTKITTDTGTPINNIQSGDLLEAITTFGQGMATLRVSSGLTSWPVGAIGTLTGISYLRGATNGYVYLSDQSGKVFFNRLEVSWIGWTRIADDSVITSLRNDIQTLLDGKSNIGHTHLSKDITDLGETIQTALEEFDVPTGGEVIASRLDIHGVEHDSLKGRLDTMESNHFVVEERKLVAQRTLRITNLGEQLSLTRVGEVTEIVPNYREGLILARVGIGADAPEAMKLVRVGNTRIDNTKREGK
jgi:3-dehydroquinate synthetase